MAGKPDVITGRAGENLAFYLSEPMTLDRVIVGSTFSNGTRESREIAVEPPSQWAPGWYRIEFDDGVISIEPMRNTCPKCGPDAEVFSTLRGGIVMSGSNMQGNNYTCCKCGARWEGP